MKSRKKSFVIHNKGYPELNLQNTKRNVFFYYLPKTIKYSNDIHVHAYTTVEYFCCLLR